nr:GTP cyclohydrolase [uncultured Flavobacterium sp.]
MISIKEVITKSELKEFIKFSFTLYKDNPYWIPPLVSDELETFDKTKNPAFDTAEARFFMAYKNGTAVGKIAAIINWQEVKEQGKSKMRFGWLDMIDEIEVTKALLNKVAEIGRENDLEHMEGPLGFSNLDKAGFLTLGYDQIGTAISWYNHPYYIDHLLQLGFVKEKEYIEGYFPIENIDGPTLQRGSEMVQKRYSVRALSFTSSKDIMPYVDEMFDVFNAAYAKLASFVAVTEKQKAYFKNKYIGLINPGLIKFVLNEKGKMVAFSIMMPDFAPALKKANGSLLPFGWYHLLKAKNKMEAVAFYLIGILPEYQNKGIHAILFSENYKAISKLGVKRCIRTPELDENNAVHNLFKSFDSVIHKRRCTYMKPLSRIES